ncbi:MAG: cupin domain-containing protein [Akkermansiaceae bacterium]|nr:cupin domain-containing protein [Akkermansiaceae bacterium]
MKKYLVEHLDEIEPTRCPCGMTRRAFVCGDNDVASIHLVDISEDSKSHYHKRLTEIYLVLEGEGYLELDGERVQVRPMTAVLIKPGCRHRALGNLKIVNIPVPAFDPNDEWFDV